MSFFEYRWRKTAYGGYSSVPEDFHNDLRLIGDDSELGYFVL
jgi:hypothetical protein